MNNPIKEFKEEVKENINRISKDTELRECTSAWMEKSMIDKYCYNFTWMGRPIIQYPQDIIAMQELIWEVKPDLIVETGIAHGGSLIFYASMMQLLGKKGHVLGVDIDIREHNRKQIEEHPMFSRITMYEGSSIDEEIVKKVHDFAKDYKKVLVVLDSCHTAEHVYEECLAFSDLVEKGSYLIVMDTYSDEFFERTSKENVQELPEHLQRPWGISNSPMAGMNKFLSENDRFIIQNEVSDKLCITACPKGYLKCVK